MAVGQTLVACEFSGRVRDALITVGVDAVSCDLLPTEAGGPHVQGDVTELLQEPWDMVIAHPPCTYLCNSGVRWLHEERSRWDLLVEGALFFTACLEANAARVAVENPRMHGYAQEMIGQRPCFAIQPWMFGDPYSKETCFWTEGLEPLEPQNAIDGRFVAHEVHNTPPSEDRWKRRSVTYPGLARAIAIQWGVPMLLEQRMDVLEQITRAA